MQLLVTGGAGFIGSNFIRYWLANHPEDEIVNIDKITYAGNLANLHGIDRMPQYSFVKRDICDRSKLMRELIRACDVIVHFAAESHVDRAIVEADEFVQTNIVGTYNLLHLALQFEKRFHHISTDEVFGSLPLDSAEKFNESTPYNPRNPYSASKAASDHLVRSFFSTYGLPITISNCSNNFGPRQNREKLIPLAITNLLQGRKVPVYGQGLNVRDWLYVEDHCRAIDLILRRGRIGETYCIGGMTEDISNIDLVKMMLEIMKCGEEMIEFVKDRPGHDQKYAVDWSKAKKELGYQPQCSFYDYLVKTIDWYRRHQDWWDRGIIPRPIA